MNNMLPLNPIDMRVFNFDMSTLELTCEASQLREQHFGRIYADACDLGTDIKSHHTGRVLRFVMTQEVTVAGEVTMWMFEPLPTARPHNVKRVVIYND